MLFESTTTLLRGIVRSIENNGEAGWDDQLESGNQCLYELHQFARSSTRTYKSSNAKFPVVAPAFERAILAIPHVKAMMRSIRQRDQAAAFQSGRAAIAQIDGTRTAPSYPPPGESKADTSIPVNSSEQPAKTIRGRKKPETRDRAVVATPKPGRVSAAISRLAC